MNRETLTSEERQQIEAQLKHYPQRRNAAIEAMSIVQKNRRWISDDMLKAIAHFLEMSPEELDNVATFYNLIFRRPVGRHVILICDSVSCYVMKYQEIVDHLSRKLNIEFGETTEDERFTMLPIPCLGTCDHAPAMIIDDDLHRDLTTEKVDKILGQYE